METININQPRFDLAKLIADINHTNKPTPIEECIRHLQ